MIDINALLAQALKSAVDEAVKPLVSRIEELENRAQSVTVAVDEKQVVEALNSQEWFWDKINRYVDGQIESAIDEHCGTYDHDQYDEVYSEWGSESSSEFVREDDLMDKVENKIRKAVQDLEISVSIR